MWSIDIDMSRLIEDRSLRDKIHVFRDRKEAGILLAKALSDYSGGNGIILAIPAGGVPVAAEIAKSLDLALDLVIVRKIQIPYNPEAGFGAVGPSGEVSLNNDLVSRLLLNEKEIERQIQNTKETITSRNKLFREGLPFPILRERVVIIVDDGLASGFTMRAAIDFIKNHGPEKVVIAVPTAPERTIDLVLPHVNELVCLNIRSGPVFAVADAYENWYDLDDEEVIAIVKSLRRDTGA
jgi:putative phosphoribosyl transferase